MACRPPSAVSLIVRRIVSGGQTGVDRAALDVALALGYPCGGWCPRGRRAEDGPIEPCYPLTETQSNRYQERTRLNVRDADATLILTRGTPVGGTKLTIDAARRAGRPCLVLDLDSAPAGDLLAEAAAWIAAERPGTLNLAGPRESTAPGIYASAYAFLHALFAG